MQALQGANLAARQMPRGQIGAAASFPPVQGCPRLHSMTSPSGQIAFFSGGEDDGYIQGRGRERRKARVLSNRLSSLGMATFSRIQCLSRGARAYNCRAHKEGPRRRQQTWYRFSSPSHRSVADCNRRPVAVFWRSIGEFSRSSRRRGQTTAFDIDELSSGPPEPGDKFHSWLENACCFKEEA